MERVIDSSAAQIATEAAFHADGGPIAKPASTLIVKSYRLSPIKLSSTRFISSRWVIITGEYPPQPGGVSDYAWQVARALVAAGDRVQVWAPPAAQAEMAADGVTIHRLPDHFGSGSRAALARAFGELPADARILVQYVPHSFGWKAMNLPFCVWLWKRRKSHHIIVMFHEVAYPWGRRDRIFRHNFLAFINRLMAAFVARSANKIFISIPGWSRALYFLSGGRPTEWMPVPSNIPEQSSPQTVQALREQFMEKENIGPNKQMVGHFGTYGSYPASTLQIIIPELLERKSSVIFLCMGRRSAEFVNSLRCKYPALAARMIGTGGLSPSEIADHIAICDLLIQPYPDGVSSRRGTVMAGLALGCPILTTRGASSEPCWEESGAVRLVDSAQEMPTEAIALLADESELARLGTAGKALYRARFDLSRTIARLRYNALAINS